MQQESRPTFRGCREDAPRRCVERAHNRYVRSVSCAVTKARNSSGLLPSSRGRRAFAHTQVSANRIGVGSEIDGVRHAVEEVHVVEVGGGSATAREDNVFELRHFMKHSPLEITEMGFALLGKRWPKCVCGNALRCTNRGRRSATRDGARDHGRRWSCRRTCSRSMRCTSWLTSS